jgi:hypothetical protein
MGDKEVILSVSRGELGTLPIFKLAGIIVFVPKHKLSEF